MAYTPINWQTGDTITAEKLNRCDNGWSVESSVSNIFTETVTTEVDGNGNFAVFNYTDSMITINPATITFDGVQYSVPLMTHGDRSIYGTSGVSGPDFTTYPFLIMSKIFNDTPSTMIYTETAGQHTVSIGVSSTSVEVSNNFKSAVATTTLVVTATTSNVVTATTSNDVTTLDKTWQEIYDAFPNVYVIEDNRKRIITQIDINNGEYVVYTDDVNFGALSASGYPQCAMK